MTRSLRDGELVREIRRAHGKNLFVYGADKTWAQLNREGIRVTRCTVERRRRFHVTRGRVDLDAVPLEEHVTRCAYGTSIPHYANGTSVPAVVRHALLALRPTLAY